MATQDWGPWRDIPFDRLAPGTTLNSRFELQPELVAAVQELVEGGPTQVPTVGDSVAPSLYSTFLPMFRAMGGRIEQGTVHTHQSVTVHSPPARVGDVLDAEVTIVSVDRENRRRPVVVDIVFRSGARRVCTTRSRYLWGYSAPKVGAR